MDPRMETKPTVVEWTQKQLVFLNIDKKQAVVSRMNTNQAE